MVKVTAKMYVNLMVVLTTLCVLGGVDVYASESNIRGSTPPICNYDDLKNSSKTAKIVADLDVNVPTTMRSLFREVSYPCYMDGVKRVRNEPLVCDLFNMDNFESIYKTGDTHAFQSKLFVRLLKIHELGVEQKILRCYLWIPVEYFTTAVSPITDVIESDTVDYGNSVRDVVDGTIINDTIVGVVHSYIRSTLSTVSDAPLLPSGNLSECGEDILKCVGGDGRNSIYYTILAVVIGALVLTVTGICCVEKCRNHT